MQHRRSPAGPHAPFTAPTTAEQDSLGPVRTRSAPRKRLRPGVLAAVVLGALGAGAAMGVALSPQPAAAPARPPSALAAHTRTAPRSASPKPSAATLKTIVLEISSSGTTTTQSFTTGSDWSLAYSFDCGSYGGRGNFIAGDPARGVLVDALAASGSATVYERGDAGIHALAVTSECSWTITVTDGDNGG